jgi:hypothetical protein
MYVEITNLLVKGYKVASKSVPSRFWFLHSPLSLLQVFNLQYQNANLKLSYEKYVHKLITTLGFLEAIFMTLHITFGNVLNFKIIFEFMLNWRAPQ